MPQPKDERVFIDENHERIARFADDFIDEADRDEFVDGLLEKHGYKRMTAWAPPEPDPKNPPRGGGRAGFVGGRRG